MNRDAPQGSRDKSSSVKSGQYSRVELRNGEPQPIARLTERSETFPGSVAYTHYSTEFDTCLIPQRPPKNSSGSDAYSNM